jgi:BMFP domain-containing protein YqiC
MVYTAIHEFAHHVHCTRSPLPVTGNSHSVKFWDIFHRMLYAAEEMGIYSNPFSKEPEFIKLTEKIRSHYLFNSGALMKDFGSLLMEAMRLCQAHHVSFEDYADRALGFHRNAAKAVIKTTQMDVDPAVGPENMKLLSRSRMASSGRMVADDLKNGKSPDMVRADLSSKLQREKTMPEIDILKEEKERLEKVMERTREKLEVIERKIVIMKARQPRKTEPQDMFVSEEDA